MIATEIGAGDGLGNQLFRYITLLLYGTGPWHGLGNRGK